MSRTPPEGKTVHHSLWEVIVDDDGDGARTRCYLGLICYALAQLIILHAIESQVVDARGDISLREIMIFATAVLAIHVFFGALLRVGSRRIGAAVTGLCNRITEKLLTLDLEAFESLDAATLQLRLSADRSIAGETGALVVEVRAALLVGVAVCAYSMTFSLLWGALMFGGFAGLEWILYGVRDRVQQQIAGGDEQRVALVGRVRSMVRGFKEIRLHRPRRTSIGQAYREEADALHRRGNRLRATYYKYHAIGRSRYYLLLGLLAFLLPTLGDHDPRTSARLMLCLFFIGSTIGWLTMYGFPRLAHSEAAWSRLREYDARLEALVIDRPQEVEPLPFQRLGLTGVCHSYPDSGFDSGFGSGPFDLTIEAGEQIFITGANGSGKSTFLKILTGLYQPRAGHILVDDTPLSAPQLPAYRALFAVLFTDFTVFQRLYGGADIAPAAVTELLEEMGLSEVVEYVDGRFSTTALSTGQRKRLALIVALLQDKPIYIFDEWTADQDPEYRVAFFTQILPALKERGKTVLVVTHDDEWFHVADRHIHFQDGSVSS